MLIPICPSLAPVQSHVLRTNQIVDALTIQRGLRRSSGTERRVYSARMPGHRLVFFLTPPHRLRPLPSCSAFFFRTMTQEYVRAAKQRRYLQKCAPYVNHSSTSSKFSWRRYECCCAAGPRTHDIADGKRQPITPRERKSHPTTVSERMW
jgi:hypothetical protein